MIRARELIPAPVGKQKIKRKDLLIFCSSPEPTRQQRLVEP